jgi:hypothetical protein
MRSVKKKAPKAGTKRAGERSNGKRPAFRGREQPKPLLFPLELIENPGPTWPGIVDQLLADR